MPSKTNHCMYALQISSCVISYKVSQCNILTAIIMADMLYIHRYETRRMLGKRCKVYFILLLKYMIATDHDRETNISLSVQLIRHNKDVIYFIPFIAPTWIECSSKKQKKNMQLVACSCDLATLIFTKATLNEYLGIISNHVE